MNTCDKSISISRDNVQSMHTTRADRIYLPFALTGDVLFWAESLIAENMPIDSYSDKDGEDERFTADCQTTLEQSTITATLHLTPAQFRPLASLHIEVVTPDDRHLTGHVYAPTASAEAAMILMEFFDAGAPGLRSDCRRVLENRFYTFFRRAALRGGAGLPAKYRPIFETFSKFVHRGHSPHEAIEKIFQIV